MSFRWIPLALCLVASACTQQPAAPQTSANAGNSEPAAAVQRKPQPGIDWSPTRLEAGDAWIDCGSDYRAGDGQPLLSLAYIDLRQSLQDCRSTGLLRLRYDGKITMSFAALAERVGRIAGDLGIGKRILDIRSAGGSVEAAIRAGDAIGENDWTIWVRSDSVCHSACVLLLAAGDMRVIAGPVGIHRMVRVGSSATSRKELGEELRRVSEELRNYLERNGASAEVYDLMTTVPNRTLHVLSDDELDRYGLSGANAVEDDLNRIRLARRCGSDFVRRRDAFRHAYSRQCTQDVPGENQDVVDMNTCGLALRERFGFPDARCPNDSPMAELDGAILAMPHIPENEGEGLASGEPVSSTNAPAPPVASEPTMSPKLPDSQVVQEAPVPADADDAKR
ncbi:hypothetical protein [Thermomonas sp.]|uniref:COG3904 family protein n=1 Tax=Thermomonas sp. TaxID=1971895 RepID=UPI00248A7803|nr:hypothetical protein [Thermomonas sp.]MDI1253944.1 hypothetical protein [Thermomonas sp.]